MCRRACGYGRPSSELMRTKFARSWPRCVCSLRAPLSLLQRCTCDLAGGWLDLELEIVPQCPKPRSPVG